MKKFSLIIPYRPDGGRRDFIWPFIQLRYQELLPEVELCIGNDDSELFCKAKAVNVAARKARGDIFVLVDAEVIFDPKIMLQLPDLLESHPWIIPFNHAYRLTKEATDRAIEAGLSTEIQVVEEDIEYRDSVPGGYMNVVTRAAFESVGGFDERFKGYGYEDMAFAMALDTIYGPHHRMNGLIYHLWHPWADFYHPHFQANLSLYRRYQTAAGHPQAMLELLSER